MAKARYQIASTSDLTAVTLPGLDGDAPSYTAAVQALREHELANPAQKGTLQVVTVFVTEGANS
jgi:hypothetical protein